MAEAPPTSAPYGSWVSRITADRIVAGTVGLGQPAIDGETIYWVESRPIEAGRNVLVRRTADGAVRDLLPPPWNVRSRAHEYGGGAYAVRDGVVVFSHDGKTLASASSDNTVRLWDPATGAHQQTLEGHSDSVTEVVFSHDCKTLASASSDMTVRLWDPATGAHQQTLEGHSDSVAAVAFSPDGRCLTTNFGSLRLSSASAPPDQDRKSVV